MGAGWGWGWGQRALGAERQAASRVRLQPRWSRQVSREDVAYWAGALANSTWLKGLTRITWSREACGTEERAGLH